MPPTGGWSSVLEALGKEWLPYLERHSTAHVLLLIDFDNESGRRARFEQEVPAPVKARVFVVGSQDEPEDVKRDTGKTFEQIGFQLADECSRESYELWDSPHINHDAEERARLSTAVRAFLFTP
jgi:hypothetical protein